MENEMKMKKRQTKSAKVEAMENFLVKMSTKSVTHSEKILAPIGKENRKNGSLRIFLEINGLLYVLFL